MRSLLRFVIKVLLLPLFLIGGFSLWLLAIVDYQRYTQVYRKVADKLYPDGEKEQLKKERDQLEFQLRQILNKENQ